MVRNRRTFNGFQYTVPSPSSYPYQWLWDSCFHAIILSSINLGDAKKELLSLVSYQFENGMIPHMIYWDKAKPKDFPVIKWGKEDTSTITQPPMLSYAVFQVYSKDKDKNFLKEIYQNLKRFYRYLIEERDPRGNHLIGIINPDESGEDNSPRFDVPLKLPSSHNPEVNFAKRIELVQQNKMCNFELGTCMRNFFWVKDVPFNAIMVENLRVLAQIAGILDLEEDKKYFLEQADLVAEAMRKFMMEDGICWSTYGTDYKKIKVKTWAIFAPLFARIYTKDEVESLIKILVDKDKFNTKFLVPTVSLDESSYNPGGFWRGPVWISVNWFIYKGLLNYGYVDLAKKIAFSSIDLIKKSGFREQFNPDTGEGLGAKEFSWGGLLLDMNTVT